MKVSSYHPAINLVFFLAAIVMTIVFNHPVYLAISYAASFAYSVKLNGKRAVKFNLWLVVFIVVWTFLFSTVNHFGVTNLAQNFIGNMITLESIVYGFVVGVIISSVLMWLSCMHVIVSSDKVVYLFGRVSPKLSLFLSILLRMVPRIKKRARTINAGQKCIGNGSGQGGFGHRVKHSLSRFSIMLTWMNESFIEMSDSMRSRGYSLKGRTAFSIYRFDNRDRSLVIFLFLCIIVNIMGAMLNQTGILYSPMIIMNRVTIVSYLFYVAYACLCFTPLFLQIVGEVRFGQLRSHVEDSEGAGLPLAAVESMGVPMSAHKHD